LGKLGKSEGGLTTLSLVVGLGEVGRPLHAVLKRVHRVEGVDLSPHDVSERVDFLHVCYPGEIPDFIGTTATYVARYKPSVVVIHSTVPVGTTRATQERVGSPVVHSPVRGKHARMQDELVHYVKFIGAQDERAAVRTAEHFEAAGIRTRRLASPEATELAKLTETTYLGVLVAFAQDVNRFAHRLGVPYEEIIEFYKEIAYLPSVQFFPGVIGGHCVMPNIDLLKRAFDSRLLDAIEWSNELRKSEG